jgi:hypothetical protein
MMTKQKVSEATEASNELGLAEAGKYAPSLIVLAIDDDEAMLKFYEAALSGDRVLLESVRDPQQGLEPLGTVDFRPAVLRIKPSGAPQN